MRERIRPVLDRLVASPPLESAWLHTLSLLEFIGARKIARTAAAHHPPLSVLEHWADETRHAAVFKSLAVTVGEGEAQPYLCGDEAKTYFSTLDETLSEWVQTHFGAVPLQAQVVNYLLVTAIIERRAMVLYPLYRAASRQPQVKEELARIIVEEQAHRVTIEARCGQLLAPAKLASDMKNARDVLAEPMALEEALFDRFWTAIERVLTPAVEARLG